MVTKYGDQGTGVIISLGGLFEIKENKFFENIDDVFKKNRAGSVFNNLGEIKEYICLEIFIFGRKGSKFIFNIFV